LADFEADSRSFGTCSPTLRATIAVTRKVGFRLADWPTGRELNPLDHDGRFQLVFTTILLPCPPDATGLELALKAQAQIREGPRIYACPSALKTRVDALMLGKLQSGLRTDHGINSPPLT
jgi:hypothetical protein